MDDPTVAGPPPIPPSTETLGGVAFGVTRSPAVDDTPVGTLGSCEPTGHPAKPLVGPTSAVHHAEACLASPPAAASDGDGDDGMDASPYRRWDKAPAPARADDAEGQGGWLMPQEREEPICSCCPRSNPGEDSGPWSPRHGWNTFNRRRCTASCNYRPPGSMCRGDGDDESLRWAESPRRAPSRLDSCVPPAVGAGLLNLGNTCFMNSILQCFTHTVPLVKALRSFNHKLPCGSQEFCVACSLRDHVELSLASSGKAISPVKFFDNLSDISSWFRRYQQEDAHEFLQCFLDRLERSSLWSNLSDKSLATKADNLVEQIFGGRLVSKLLCCNCGHYSDKFEPLIDLSLEIEDVSSLESALESFTKVEKIEDPEVKITCKNCKEEASMEKQLMLDRTPLVAALHLKRFKTDGMSVEKIGKHVKFPLELDLKPYTNGHQDGCADMKYQLFAFVVHHGLSPTYGHYFCYIRSSPDTWHKMDDAMVTEVGEEEVLSEAAYILFYAREGTPWFSSFVEALKLSPDCCNSNPSPKSVLENMDDDEHTVYCGLGSADNLNTRTSGEADLCSSMDFLHETKLEGYSTSETMDDAAENSAEIILAPEKNCPDLSGYESNTETPMADNLVPLREIVGLDEVENNKSCLPPEQNDTDLGTENPTRSNGGLSPVPLRSLNPDSYSGGLPGARNKIPREHLKVENRVIRKVSRSVPAMDSKKREALRYMNKSNMPSGRRLMLLAAIAPHSDGKRSLKSSPRKKATSPISCSRFMRHMPSSSVSRRKLVRRIGFSGQ